jgi:hypothetical protein
MAASIASYSDQIHPTLRAQKIPLGLVVYRYVGEKLVLTANDLYICRPSAGIRIISSSNIKARNAAQIWRTDTSASDVAMLQGVYGVATLFIFKRVDGRSKIALLHLTSRFI